MRKRRPPRYFIVPFNGDNLVRAYSFSNAVKFFLCDVNENIRKATRVATPDEIARLVSQGVTPLDATGDAPEASNLARDDDSSAPPPGDASSTAAA